MSRKKKKRFKKVCKFCGKMFETSVRTRQYCSSTCRRGFYPRGTIFKKKCLVCGKEFTTQIRTQKYCSAKCNTINVNRLAKIRRQQNPIIRICKICKQPFKTNKHYEFYCSAECWKEGIRRYNREYARKKRILTYNLNEKKICKYTGEILTLKEYVSKHENVPQSKVKNLPKKVLVFRNRCFKMIQMLPMLKYNYKYKKIEERRCLYCNKPNTSKTIIRDNAYFCDDNCYRLYSRLRKIAKEKAKLIGGAII